MANPLESSSGDPAAFALEDPELPLLVAEAMEARDSGFEVDLARICVRRPDLLEAVRASLETGKRLGALQAKSSSSDRYLGKTLGGRYRLEQRLGSGAMGVVYRAYDEELKRIVAVKVLRAVLIDSREAELRFQREAEILASLDHPSLVGVLDRGRTPDEAFFLVMEFVEGRTLQDLLDRRRSLPFGGDGSSWLRAPLGDNPAVAQLFEGSFLRTVVRWTADLAAALEAAHARRVYHRDVKPSNILVRNDGRAVLVDFGIATAAGDETITRDGQPLGTPAYSAPEVLHHGTEPGPALDVYGLASTLYAALAGRPPYEGTPSQVLARLAVHEPEPLAYRDRAIPRDLAAIVEKGMERDPARRYASAALLEADLRAFLEHRPISARPVSRARRTARKLARSSTARGAATAVALVALALYVRVEWQAHSERVDQHAFEEGLRRIPPKLGIANFEHRASTTAEEYAAVMSALDTALESKRYTIPAGPLRAAYLHDHGRAREAAAQMAQVAESVGTDYAKELARRYTSLPPDSSTSDDLALSGLPSPNTPADRYLALLHALRAFDDPATFELLGSVRDDDAPAFREYALLFSTAAPAEVQQGTLTLEAELGGRTAMTADILGLSLILQGHYGPAYRIYQEALTLCPMSYVLHENIATAALHAVSVDAALEHCDRVSELRPMSIKAWSSRILFLLAGERVDEARAAWEAAPFGEHASGRAERARLAADIHTVEALVALRLEGPDTARAEASRALDWFEALRAAGKNPEREERYPLARVLAGAYPSSNELVAALIDWTARAPLERTRVATALDALESSSFAEPAAPLVTYLRAVQEAVATRRTIDEERIAEALRAPDRTPQTESSPATKE